MAVRVKVQIEFKNKKVEAVALANAGYETDEDEILIPMALAKIFNSINGHPETYHTIAGNIDLFNIGKAKVKVITKDKKTKPIEAKVFIAPYETEVVINDKLVQDLGIILIKVKDGIWRFLDDPIGKERQSEQRQSW